MLAYVFWHRPLDDLALEAYEQAEIALRGVLLNQVADGRLGQAAFTSDARNLKLRRCRRDFRIKT